MKGILIAVLFAVAGLAQAQPWAWDSLVPRVQGDPRHMPPPHRGDPQRWEERRRLREEVRSGKMSRDDAVRQYRDKFGERPAAPGPAGASEQRRDEYRSRHPEGRRLSPEEREQLRRDIMDANRKLAR